MNSITQTNHTPGPWVARDGAVFGPHACIAGTDFGPDYIHRNQREANARLMAAAPELLAMVKTLVKHVETYEMDRSEAEDVNAARRLVAKAEGRA